MARLILAVCSVTLTLFIVPIVVYGILSKPLKLTAPSGVSPTRFLLSTLVSKLGTAILLTTLYSICRETIQAYQAMYIFLWWIMFVLGETGQAIGPNYSWKEAAAGVLSETIYIPLAVFITGVLL